MMVDTPINERKKRDPFGRIALDDNNTPDTEISNITNPTNLSESVGTNGMNQRRDVAKVEKLLGDVGTLDLKQTDGPTGYWGMRTDDATRAFQKKHGLKVDGDINPDGPTVKKLRDVRDAAKRRKERRGPRPMPNKPSFDWSAKDDLDTLDSMARDKAEDDAKKRALKDATNDDGRKRAINETKKEKKPDRTLRGGGVPRKGYRGRARDGFQPWDYDPDSWFDL